MTHGAAHIGVGTGDGQRKLSNSQVSFPFRRLVGVCFSKEEAELSKAFPAGFRNDLERREERVENISLRSHVQSSPIPHTAPAVVRQRYPKRYVRCT